MKKKLLIITGANGQVGSYLARSHAGGGDPLLLLYHEDVARITDLRGNEGLSLKACDLTSFNETSSAIQAASRELDAIPARLIHTAAQRSYDAKPLAESDPEIFSQVLQTNLMMAYNVLRVCLPDMIANGFGRIVLFGSNVVSTGLRNGAAYSAAKAGIVNLVRSVALETASANVLINSISPSPVETDLEADYSGDYLKFRREYFERFRRLSPTGKLVSKKEIKSVVELLLSEDIENLNGANVTIDGGLSIALTGKTREGN